MGQLCGTRALTSDNLFFFFFFLSTSLHFTSLSLSRIYLSRIVEKVPKNLSSYAPDQDEGNKQQCNQRTSTSRIVCTVTIRKPADRGNHQEKRAEWTRWLCEEKPIQYMKLLNLKEVSQFSFKTKQ